MDLSDIRKDYRHKSLEIDSVNSNPLAQLEVWLSDAGEAQCPEHTAMILSTATTDGQPSSRIVLLKYLDTEGLFFFTNYESRKGKELDKNQHAAACFFWPDLERQVRIEGLVTKSDPAISDLYFKSRPYESQISAIVSPQSSEITDRKTLEKDWNKIYLDWTIKELERPYYWGGFVLKPSRFEFWQGRPNRLHDRIVFKKKFNGWKIKRLAP
jgi:pyridoxamine 5'-phosphate oxidase